MIRSRFQGNPRSSVMNKRVLLAILYLLRHSIRPEQPALPRAGLQHRLYQLTISIASATP